MMSNCSNNVSNNPLEAVARSFSKAARTYDQHAEFQRISGNKLLSILEQSIQAEPIEVLNVVDVGCGTGFFTRKLAELYPEATVCGVDIAPGMIEVAQERARDERYMTADAYQLPFADNSQDVIFSNLTFQWLENLPALFAELERVRSKHGIVVFSSLGPQTLFELKAAWKSLDDRDHINQFLEPELIAANGKKLWDSFQIQQELFQMEYTRVLDLMRDLKGIGAQHRGKNRKKGLSTAATLAALEKEYAQFRCGNQKLPATYELILAISTGF